MKLVAAALTITAAVLAAVAVSGAPQQLIPAGIIGIIAIAWWRAY